MEECIMKQLDELMIAGADNVRKDELKKYSEWELLTIQRNCYRIINLIDEIFGEAESIHGLK